MKLFDDVYHRIINNQFNFALILLLALPPILEAIYIKTYGVNVILWDDFNCYVPYIEKLYTGFSVNDVFSLFNQHNEHRIFFPRIIILISAYVTHYNTVVEMYISWIITIIILILIFKMYGLDIKNFASLVTIVPVSWIVFNFGRQSENILWGSPGIVGNLTILGFVTSIYMLEKTDKIDYKFIFAIFCGLVSSFSFLNGLLIWPVGFIFITLSKTKNRSTFLLIWVVTSIIVTITYFYNWTKPSYHPSLSFAIENFSAGIRYLLVNIGSPMSFEQNGAFVIGTIFVALVVITLVIVAKNKLMAENAKWITFILFSFMSSVAITFGRSGFGTEYALSSRYTTFTSFGFIGLYLIVSNLYNSIQVNKNQRYAILCGMVLSIILVGTSVGYMNSMDIGKSLLSQREYDAYYLTNYKLSTDKELKNLHPSADVVRNRAEVLQKYSLNVFYSSVQNWNLYKRVSGGKMIIDTIDERSYSEEAVINVDENKSISLSGWAVDDNAKDGAVKVYILFSGGEDDIIIPTKKVYRQDVGNYFGIDSYEQSGWLATIVPRGFKDKCYNISVRIMKTGDNEYYELTDNRYICFNRT